MGMLIAAGAVLVMYGFVEEAKGEGMHSGLCDLAYYTEDCTKCQFQVGIKNPETGDKDYRAFGWQMQFVQSVRWGRLIPDFEAFECCDTSESLNCCNMFDDGLSTTCDDFAFKSIPNPRPNMPMRIEENYSPFDDTKQCSPLGSGWECHYFIDEDDSGLKDGEIAAHHVYTGPVPNGTAYILAGLTLILAGSFLILGKCIHTVRANERTYRYLTVQKRKRDLEVLVDYLGHLATSQYNESDDLPSLEKMTRGLIPPLTEDDKWSFLHENGRCVKARPVPGKFDEVEILLSPRQFDKEKLMMDNADLNQTICSLGFTINPNTKRVKHVDGLSGAGRRGIQKGMKLIDIKWSNTSILTRFQVDPNSRRPQSAPAPAKNHDKDLANKIGMGKHRGLKKYDDRSTHQATHGRIYGTHLPRTPDPAHITRNKMISKPARAFKTLGINNFHVEERKFCRPVSAPSGQTVFWTGGKVNKNILKAMHIHDSVYDIIPEKWTHPRDTAPVHKSVQV